MAVYRIPPRRLRKTKSLAWYAAVVVDTLTVQDAAVVAVGEVLALVQEHTLVVSDSLSQAAAEVVSLQQEQNLVVTDGASKAVADSLDLVQEHVLAASDGASSAVAETVDLFVLDQLTVADAVVKAAGDVEALTQEHNLVIADAAVVNVGESVNVVQSGVNTLSQHSFRFRNDDGDEDAATWAAALNNNLSLAPDNVIRLRFLIDAGGDNAGTQFRLEYKKTTDVDWSVAA